MGSLYKWSKILGFFPGVKFHPTFFGVISPPCKAGKTSRGEISGARKTHFSPLNSHGPAWMSRWKLGSMLRISGLQLITQLYPIYK